MKKKLLLFAFILPTLVAIVIFFLMLLKDEYQYLSGYYWGLIGYMLIMIGVLNKMGIKV